MLVHIRFSRLILMVMFAFVMNNQELPSTAKVFAKVRNSHPAHVNSRTAPAATNAELIVNEGAAGPAPPGAFGSCWLACRDPLAMVKA